MKTYSFSLPEDEVECITLRKMSDAAGGQWLCTLSHRFGSVYDQHGRILGPTAPHGVATSSILEDAVDGALQDLRKEVHAQLEKQNSVKTCHIPSVAKSSESVDDLLKLLDLE